MGLGLQQWSVARLSPLQSESVNPHLLTTAWSDSASRRRPRRSTGSGGRPGTPGSSGGGIGSAGTGSLGGGTVMCSRYPDVVRAILPEHRTTSPPPTTSGRRRTSRCGSAWPPTRAPRARCTTPSCRPARARRPSGGRASPGSAGPARAPPPARDVVGGERGRSRRRPRPAPRRPRWVRRRRTGGRPWTIALVTSSLTSSSRSPGAGRGDHRATRLGGEPTGGGRPRRGPAR